MVIYISHVFIMRILYITLMITFYVRYPLPLDRRQRDMNTNKENVIYYLFSIV